MVLRASHTPLNFSDLEKHFSWAIGFDQAFDRLSSHEFLHGFPGTGESKFPPYNIRKDGEKYTIELAIAGFSEDDLEVELKKQTLTIRSKKEEDKLPTNDRSNRMIHQGIAKRQFSKGFALSDDVVVQGCELNNGLLTIELERIIPEEMRPRMIPIGKKNVKEIN